MFRCKHHHQGAHYSCLLQLQLLKEPINIHRCVVNSVVMWLRILGLHSHEKVHWFRH